MSLFNTILILFLAVADILGQEFGKTIDEDQNIQISAAQRETEGATIESFDVYIDENNAEKISLEIKVPVQTQESDVNTRKIYIIDFKQYSPLSNPIVNGSISSDLISNCTNLRLSEPQSLADTFSDTVVEEGGTPFFEPNLMEADNDEYFILYSHDGLLSEFNYCTTASDKDRNGVWSSTPTSGNSGKVKHTTALVVNELIVSREEYTNETRYQTGYFSTTFQLTWSISQYIFVNAVLASQKRVLPEVIYASITPHWEGGILTESSLVHIAIRTTLENAYHNHIMMVFVKDSNSGIFAVAGGPQFEARNMPPTGSSLVPCDAHRNYDLEAEGLGQDNYLDCQQIWEFDFVLPPRIAAYKEVEGVFSFQLQLYECDDLSADNPDCGSVDGVVELITTDLTLDTFVQVVAEQENTLTLEVTAIKSKDNSADFLTSSPLSRGIYHREDVILYIQPTQNINKTPGADLISQYGLLLTAFFVCIENSIEIGSRMGCLDVDPKDRYIPYMEEDLSVSIHGKMYYRTDFEDTKQSLATHSWDAELGYYTIEFKNLALSAKTRLYRMTMIFRLALTAETSPVEPETRKRRSITLSQPLTFKKRAVKVENSTNSEVYSSAGAVINSSEIVNVVSTDVEFKPNSYTMTDDEETNDSNSNDSEIENNGTITEKSDTNDNTETTTPDATFATTDVEFKSGSCPEGSEFVSTDEACRPSEASRHAVVSCGLMSVLLHILLTVVH